jgi:FAD/FMN-containing dehydrogenase
MAIELPAARPADEACLDELARRLGPQRVLVDDATRSEASRDYAWLSPVLTAAIPEDAIADAVVRPCSVDELGIALGVAYRHDVAVTPRGKGTGNYGQAVPLARGLVLDTSGLDGVIDVGDGWIDAYAGTSFTRLEAAARATGQELAIFPSTTSSLLGGFLSGGAGGTGSVENGWIWDGYVGAMTMMPCWDAPAPIELGADAALPHLHAYGTTGVVVSARVRLREARPWTALFASFPTFEAAAEAGLAVLELEALPRNLAVDDARLVAAMGATHPAMPPDRASMRAVVVESSADAIRRIVVARGGVVEAVQRASTSLCVSLSYNHVTLRAKRADPSVCHVQVGGPPLFEQYREVVSTLPDGMLHLDAMMRDGEVGYGGLYLARFEDRDTLYGGMDRLRELGLRVLDPHTWMLGSHGVIADTVAQAEQNDPKGLLNPGKLPRP